VKVTLITFTGSGSMKCAFGHINVILILEYREIFLNLVKT